MSTAANEISDVLLFFKYDPQTQVPGGAWDGCWRDFFNTWLHLHFVIFYLYFIYLCLSLLKGDSNIYTGLIQNMNEWILNLHINKVFFGSVFLLNYLIFVLAKIHLKFCNFMQYLNTRWFRQYTSFCVCQWWVTEMEEGYKIALTKLWAWQISTQNMSGKCSESCKNE